MDKKNSVSTVRQIQALRPKERRYNVTVNAARMARGGLIIRVLPGGTKTYYSRLRLSGSQIDIQLGLVNAMSCSIRVHGVSRFMSKLIISVVGNNQQDTPFFCLPHTPEMTISRYGVS